MTLPVPTETTDTTGRTSAFIIVLGWFMLVLAAVGLATNATLLAIGAQQWLPEYGVFNLLAGSLILSVMNLFGSYFHYRRTRMRIDWATRILSNLWLASGLALLVLAYRPA